MIRYIHFRGHNGGAITARVRKEEWDVNTDIVFAFCSPHDQFSRAEGRRISTQRDNSSWKWHTFRTRIQDPTDAMILQEALKRAPNWMPKIGDFFTRHNRYYYVGKGVTGTTEVPGHLYKRRIKNAELWKKSNLSVPNRKRKDRDGSGGSKESASSRKTMLGNFPSQRDKPTTRRETKVPSNNNPEPNITIPTIAGVIGAFLRALFGGIR